MRSLRVRVNAGRVLVTIFVALLFCATGFSQETTGALRGTVTDPTGAVIPGATVELTSPALIRTATQKTGSDGTYNFLTLPPGDYTISVAAQGFVNMKHPNIGLQIGKILRVDFRLEIGGTTQTVEVVSEAAIVDTSQATIAANVSASSFDHLPKGRGFDALIALAPGARYEAKAGGYQVDGASGSENVYVVDGMDQTDLYHGTLPASGNIPFEFVQEIQIKSSGFAAEYGGAMGGVVNVVTKSGSNDFHGDAGFYYRNADMQARPRRTLQLNPEDDMQMQYVENFPDAYRYISPGATIGGPIKKDKVWFFAGFYPELVKYERPVTFIGDTSSQTFTQKTRRDYTNAKIDLAPISKLRAYAGYIYSPYRVNGLLPNRDGSSDPTAPWADEGNRTAAASYTFGGDYSLTPKLVASVRGGYNYTNLKDYGVQRGVSLYENNNMSVAGVPDQWRQSYSGYIPGYNINSMRVKLIETRFRTNSDISYIFNLGGQHTLKAGHEINKLHLDSSQGNWPDGYLRFYWKGSYTGQAAKSGQTMTGTYGYLRYYLYGESGAASSNNNSIFLQDSWQVHRRLTLQLGVRTEREFVPAFNSGNGIPSTAIEFGFGQKLAPRIGAAWDVKGDGKWKVAGSFGLFYDLMKYALPQGSFGGAIYKMWFYPLNNPDPAFYLPKVPRAADGTALPQPLKDLPLFESVDYRLPSNEPDDNRIDPNLKPMRRRVYDISTDYALTPTMVVSARYTHNSVDRIIEDVGMQTSEGEKYYIANPGFGITADPKSWGAGFPVTPKAVRNYDALEVRLDKRFSRNYYFSASYTLSRMWGNWTGLASSDEPDGNGVGRTDPNVSRYFDLPWMSFDSHGKLVEGLLPTDRPHAFKFFGAYTLKSKLGETTFGPSFYLMSGTPLSTQVNFFTSTPVFVNGRGDLGRTPMFSNTDFLFSHEIKIPKKESMRVKFDVNITNLFNQSTVLGENTDVLNGNYTNYLTITPSTDFFKGFDYPGMLSAAYAAAKASPDNPQIYPNPLFGKANVFQGPRSIRLGLKFMF